MEFEEKLTLHCQYLALLTFRKEMKCSGYSKILRKKFRDTTQITSCISDSRVVSRTISCTISESPLHHTYSNYCRKSLPAWSPWGSSSSASSPPSCHSTATLKIQIVVSLIPSFSLSLSLFPSLCIFLSFPHHVYSPVSQFFSANSAKFPIWLV